MLCIRCGAELSADARFCQSCGVRQTRNCASCASELPPDARFCGACGAKVQAGPSVKQDLSRRGLLGADAERRQLTVMFCDLAGSTEISQRLDVEDFRRLVNEYHLTTARQIERFDGHVAQFQGDGVVAFFGYPQVHEDSAARAVSAGLAIAEATAALSDRTMRDLGLPLDVRVGLHTGIVVIGETDGGRHSLRLTVGDVPNIAARIQAEAEPNQVLISGTTAQLVERRFLCESQGAFELKGVARPLTLFLVTGERGPDEEPDEDAGLRVDREREVRSLLQHWQAATRGAGRAILLAGEAGIGKSSVLRFLRRELASARPTVRRLSFSEHHRQSAYRAFAEQMGRECGFERSDDNDLRVRKLLARLDEQGEERGAYLGVYQSLLSLQLPPEMDTGPEPTKALTNLALEHWVLADGNGSPLLLEIEDLHWADPSSLDVIVGLANAVQDRSALMLMTARDEFDPPWQRDGDDVLEIRIGRLEDEHISKIIGGTAKGAALPDSVVASMLQRVDGVPIFAEELTKAVLDSDELRSTDASSRADALDIPMTLRDSLMARLDRISEFRGLVLLCSVIGREFDVETLEALSGLEEAALEPVLDQLVQRQIMLRTETQGLERYAFRHALLRDEAYSSMLRSERADMHRKMGELLECRLAEVREGDPVAGEVIRELAYHWGLAARQSREEQDVIKRAVQHLTTAGERELMLSGYKEAGAHLEHAMELVTTLPDGRDRDELELTVRTRRSTVHKATVGPAAEEVRVELERCHALCEQLGHRPELGPVLYSFWQLHLFRAQYPESLRYAKLCLAEAGRSGNLDMLVQSYVALSNTHFWFCDLAEAERSYNLVLAHYDPARHGHHAMLFGMDPGVLALMFGTWVPQITGRLAEAAERHAEVERLSDTLRHALSRALALNTSCCYHVNRGDAEGARAAGQEMIDLARLHGLFVYEIIGIHFRGWGAAKAGEVDRVIDEVRGTYASYVQHVGGLAQTYIAMLAAGVFEEAGEVEEAIETLERALAVAEAEECRELAYHAELLRLRGDLLARAGRDDEALEALRTSLDLAVERGQPPFALRAAVGLLRIAERRDEGLDAARDLLRAQLERFGPDESDEELDRAEALLG